MTAGRFVSIDDILIIFDQTSCALSVKLETSVEYIGTIQIMTSIQMLC